MHVAAGVDRHQRGDERDHAQHDRRQRIGPQRHVDRETASVAGSTSARPASSASTAAWAASGVAIALVDVDPVPQVDASCSQPTLSIGVPAARLAVDAPRTAAPGWHRNEADERQRPSARWLRSLEHALAEHGRDDRRRQRQRRNQHQQRWNRTHASSTIQTWLRCDDLLVGRCGRARCRRASAAASGARARRPRALR